MKQRRSQRWLFGWVLACLVSLTLTVAAQTDCPYATLRLETDMPVDAEAICAAARPWSEQGVRVLVFLTDERPETEDDWFERLDQVEAEAGFRDASQADSFLRNGLAFEASMDANLNWAQSITYGENLNDTPFSTDPNLIPRLKSEWQTDIALGNATRAMVDTLNEAHTLTYPPPSPWVWVGIAVMIIGGGAMAGFAFIPRYLQPILARRREQQALQAHLTDLQQRTANLMAALDRLLSGDTPADTILYQLFSAYGGDLDESMKAEVSEALTHAREALNDAFDLRQQLLKPASQTEPDLEETVHNWELLYLTLSGSDEQLLTLTDEELRALLDPLLAADFKREAAPSSQLATQLDDLRRQLAGMPLKVEPELVDLAEVDENGILGEVARVKGQIAFLKEAQVEAPRLVERARAQRGRVAELIPADFLVPAAELLQGIDTALNEAEADLAANKAVAALDQAEAVMHHLETIQVCVAVVEEHQRIKERIKAITGRGYQPLGLPETLRDIETDLTTVTDKLRSHDYESVGRWTEELRLDDQHALKQTQDWQALENANATALNEINERLTQLQHYHSTETKPAWQSLQNYPDTNWADLSSDLTTAEQLLHSLASQITEIERLNSLAVQQLTEAERLLDQAFADQSQAERRLHAVVNRLAEVRTAETHLPDGLTVAQADLKKAVDLRDRENTKISPAIDRQLEEADRSLTQARQAYDARNFIGAANAQAKVRELALSAYTEATAQVKRINDLQAQLSALIDQGQGKLDSLNSQLNLLPPAARTSKTNAFAQQAQDALSQAQQARLAAADREDLVLAEALQQAVDAFQEAMRLSGQALTSIAEDRGTYDQLYSNVQEAIREARAAVRQAEFTLQHPDSGAASRQTLGQAKNLLPEPPPPNMPVAALRRIVTQANDARLTAQRAETVARQRIEAEARQRRGRTLPPVIFTSSSGRPTSSGRPSRPSYSSSRPSSSSSSSSRSSTRSSSLGASRRSSSMGSSRRR